MFIVDGLFLGWLLRKWLRKNNLSVGIVSKDQPAPLPTRIPNTAPWEPAEKPYNPRHSMVPAKQDDPMEYYRQVAWQNAA